MPIREYPFPQSCNIFYAFQHDSEIKTHASYQSAKAGDKVAATDLVYDLALGFIKSIAIHMPENAIYVAPFARELAGDNAIPPVLAAACAVICNGCVDEIIVQANRVFHTGADPMERLTTKAEFDGQVKLNEIYVLVDDLTNMGGTIAELADYIQRNGGIIGGVVVLVNAGRNKQLSPNPKNLKQLKQRFPNEIRDIFNIEIDALTANEASYLIGFRTADEIRNRVIKAREETNLRLRSKGIF